MFKIIRSQQKQDEMLLAALTKRVMMDASVLMVRVIIKSNSYNRESLVYLFMIVLYERSQTMIQVNAMGDACPLPVVKTKNALESLTSADIIETLVDNDVAVQNLLRFAKNRGLVAKQKTLGENAFAVVIEVPASSFEESAPEGEKDAIEEYLSCSPLVCEDKPKKVVVVIASDRMGSGDDALGETLMKSFVYALTQQDRLPDTILTYNGGVKLACEGSPAFNDLKEMKSRGVTIFSCGTCLNFYDLSDKLGVGESTNMYEIVAMMLEADRIVKP